MQNLSALTRSLGGCYTVLIKITLLGLVLGEEWFAHGLDTYLTDLSTQHQVIEHEHF